MIIGDMNARGGDSEGEGKGVVGKFGVSWANENETKLSCVGKETKCGKYVF